jgi:hypothetical protein
MEKKIKLVVIDDCMLGYILPETSNYATILASSVIRGGVSAGTPLTTKYIVHRNIRLATKEDFDIYRVCIKGYENDPAFEMDTAS